jgi:metallo-beta-lactamase class B
MMRLTFVLALAITVAVGSPPLYGQVPDTVVATPPSCTTAADWNIPHPPVQVYGNTYYVGTHCLSAILVASRDGHVLIDAGLPESAPLIRASIEALGFRIADVKLILNSHAHFDHAGGIAAVQHASGAAVAASPASARVLEAGASGPDDPQYGELPTFPATRPVRVLAEGEVVRVGPIALTAHWTPGHTPGGTTWSWVSCEGEHCLDMVYADSQTPISAEGFFFTRSSTYPEALRDFERGHALLERLPCDLLLTPHPGASALWERVAARASGGAPPLVDSGGCRAYAATAREQLTRRIAAESTTR